MPRPKKLCVGMLNVRLPSHTPADYPKLFNFCAKNRIRAAQRGNRAALIGRLVGKDVGDDMVQLGWIYQFTELDKNAPWLKVRDEAVETDEEVEVAARANAQEVIDEVDIPDNLKPELRDVMFAFFPVKHRLVFDASSHGMTPNTALRIFETMFADRRVRRKFGEVAVSLQQSSEALEAIFAIKKIRRLEMQVAMPNPDDFESLEREILERLRIQNAQTIETHLTAQRGAGIEPDDETRALAEVAISNGHVKAVGINDEGVKIKESSLDHPLLDVSVYNPAEEAEIDAFLNIAQRMVRAVSRGLRRPR